MFKNARDVIRESMGPYLEPGEMIQQVFGAQTGPSAWWAALSFQGRYEVFGGFTFPWWAALRSVVLAFGAKYRTVAVTDRAIVMCRSSMWRPYKAKEFGARLPRSIQLGQAKGFVPFVRIWYTTTIGPNKVHIHRRFQDDLRQADAAIGVIW